MRYTKGLDRECYCASPQIMENEVGCIRCGGITPDWYRERKEMNECKCNDAPPSGIETLAFIGAFIGTIIIIILGIF